MFSRVNELLINKVFDFPLNIVFNGGMASKKTAVHVDWQLILDLGGPTAVAKLLGYDLKKGGVQRVHNWRERGIPPSVKITFPSLFLKGISLDASDDVQPPVGTSSRKKAKKKV